MSRFDFVNTFPCYDAEGKLGWGGEWLPGCPGVCTRRADGYAVCNKCGNVNFETREEVDEDRPESDDLQNPNRHVPVRTSSKAYLFRDSRAKPVLDPDVEKPPFGFFGAQALAKHYLKHPAKDPPGHCGKTVAEWFGDQDWTNARRCTFPREKVSYKARLRVVRFSALIDALRFEDTLHDTAGLNGFASESKVREFSKWLTREEKQALRGGKS